MALYALVDCNNFFASCERAFKPKLANKPVVVLSNNDGCVVARSNEAKSIGIGMGVPYFEVRELIEKHQVAVFSSNFQLYGDMSHRVMNILHQFTPDVEVYSIDEAFIRLDNPPPEGYVALGEAIRQRVLKWTGLPVSVGIAPTKTLAKVAAGISKKQGRCFVMATEEEISAVRQATPVEDIWGVGRKLASSLRMAGIGTAEQLAAANDRWVRQKYSISMLRKVHELRGLSCDGIEEEGRTKHAIMASRSFGKPLTQLADIQEALSSYTARAARKLREQESVARIVSVYLQTSRHNPHERYYANYELVELPAYSCDTAEFSRYARAAIAEIFVPGLRYKKCGMSLMDLAPASLHQQSLFESADDQRQRERQVKLMQAMDAINHRVGKDMLRFGGEGVSQGWHAKSDRCSPRYTTRWEDLLHI